MSGEGNIKLTGGKALIVYGGLNGTITLSVDDDLTSGSTIAWSPLNQIGNFVLDHNGFQLKAVDTGSWIRWDSMITRTINATVSNREGGSVTPDMKSIANGDDAVIHIYRNPGYKIKSVMVNNVERVMDVIYDELILDNVQEDTDIIISFEKMKYTDVENDIKLLPTPDSGSLSQEDISTILDTKIDYESLANNEKVQLDKDAYRRLHEALEALPAVKISVLGNISIHDQHILLDNMTIEEAQKLKSGVISNYEIAVVVEEIESGTSEEENSIKEYSAGTKRAAQYDISIKKRIRTSTGDEEFNLSALTKPITLVFHIPEELNSLQNGGEREFSMLRTHMDNGVYTTTVLPDEDNTSNTYTVISHLFSKYTLIYRDDSLFNDENNQNFEGYQNISISTGYHNFFWIWTICMLSSGSILLYFLYMNKKRLNR